MNELRLNKTEIEILKFLYEKFEKEETDIYLNIIRKAIGKSIPTTKDNLKLLESKGMVKSRPNPNQNPNNFDTSKPTRFYDLTDKGQAFGWAFLYTEDFVTLYKTSVRK